VTRHLGWAKLKSGRSLALVRVQLPDKTHAKAVAALLADQEQMLPPERRRAWQFFARSLLRRRADEPIINFYLGLLDKRALAGTKADIDREVERAARMVARGGYIPGFDHMIPPDVPWENYYYAAQEIKKVCYGVSRL